jgi:hypothetical protein
MCCHLPTHVHQVNKINFTNICLIYTTIFWDIMFLEGVRLFWFMKLIQFQYQIYILNLSKYFICSNKN